MVKLYHGEIKTELKMNTEVVQAKAFAVPMILLFVADELEKISK